jgi:hypothetical protein
MGEYQEMKSAWDESQKHFRSATSRARLVFPDARMASSSPKEGFHLFPLTRADWVA